MSKELHEMSGGAFNSAVFLLSDLWGFSPRFMIPVQSRPVMPYDRTGGPASALPDERYIQAFTRLADFSACVLSTADSGQYILTKTAPDEIIDSQVYSLQIDFGSIGKGYAARKVAELLIRYGYQYGLVNIGSSSFQLLDRYADKNGSSDRNPLSNDYWPINIRSPFDQSINFLSAYGKNEGISTSGTYDSFYTIGNKRYSHIIDTKTGYPIDGEIVSATIIGYDAAWDDAVTTALCVMSVEEARQFMQNHLSDHQVILILKDGSIISNTERYYLY